MSEDNIKSIKDYKISKLTDGQKQFIEESKKYGIDMTDVFLDPSSVRSWTVGESEDRLDEVLFQELTGFKVSEKEIELKFSFGNDERSLMITIEDGNLFVDKKK